MSSGNYSLEGLFLKARCDILNYKGGGKMNCDEVIAKLVETLKPYTENSNIEISSDLNLVMVDSENNVGIEVFDNEIIIYYFTDHYHFEDYSSELEEGDKDYVERAKCFLKELFEEQIRRIEYYKG